MIILREDIVTYTKDELYDLVLDNSELNEFEQDLICQFIDKCSVQIAGIEHQMTRQPLSTKLYKDFFQLKSEFVKLVNWLIETKIENQGELNKSLDSFLGKAKEFVDSLSSVVSIGTANILDKHYNDLEVVISKFKTDSVGFIEKQDIDTSQSNLLQINEFDSDIDTDNTDIPKSKSKPIKKYKLIQK